MDLSFWKGAKNAPTQPISLSSLPPGVTLGRLGETTAISVPLSRPPSDWTQMADDEIRAGLGTACKLLRFYGRTWPERFVDTKQGERNQLGNARRHSGQGALVVMEEGPFSRQVIETLAKRAGNICSNPDCQAMATGPGETESQSVRIGEAAHIYGTNACSPRFDAAMSAAVHSDITNAIWLCRDCYQLVVADPTGFPAALLFEWRRDHEKAVTERTGKRGELARQRVESRELEDFKDCGYLAQRIVIDKPDYWEYKLTAELLRHKMEGLLSRWRSLSKGLYAQPTTRVSLDEVVHWHKSRLEELLSAIGAIKGLINSELPTSWGPPGTAGSETEILRVCDLLTKCCQRLLDWEESVRFASVPNDFEAVKNTFIGIGGRQIEKLSVIPAGLVKVFEQAEPKGSHLMEIVIDLPEGWHDQALQAMRAAVRKAFGT